MGDFCPSLGHEASRAGQQWTKIALPGMLFFAPGAGGGLGECWGTNLRRLTIGLARIYLEVEFLLRVSVAKT
ncbi:MAG: hypothetical protein ACI97A_001223 [Planctomycetota bacterium]|jgi:hypothetical protein